MAGSIAPETRRFAIWLALLSAARLALAPCFELVPQEAFYVFYARHPALSYLEHPPAIALLLRAATHVLGPGEFSIRLAAWSVTLATQIAFYRLAQRLLPRREALLAAVLFSGTAAVSMLSLVATPDVPLLLFWTLALLALHRAVFGDHPRSWIWAGLWMGLGFDSKYTAALLPAGLIGFLLVSGQHRRKLKSPWPWLSIGIAQLVMLPVYLWNFQHRMASFSLQSVERLAGASPGPRFFLALLATQSVLLFPPLFIAILRALGTGWRALRSGSAEPGPAFLYSFSAPLLLIGIGLSFVILVKANWLLPAYLAATILAARSFRPWLVRAQLGTTLAAHLLLVIEVATYVVPIRSDDTWYGWRALASEVTRRAAAHPGVFVFSADGYKEAAELLYYSALPVYGANILGRRAGTFDYVQTGLEALRGHDALFIDSAPRDLDSRPAQGIPEELGSFFENVRQEPPILIRRGDRVVRKFFVYDCRGYLGPHGASRPLMVSALALGRGGQPSYRGRRM